VRFAPRPRTVGDNADFEQWTLTLGEVIELALTNCRFIRSNAQFLSTSNPLLANPDQVPSVFDPAIQDSGFLYGQRGEQAALADFDTQFVLSSVWGHDERVQNNRFLSGGLLPGETLVEDTGKFSAQLRKPIRSGGQFALIHDWDYNESNRTGLLFPSVFDGTLRLEFRQPVLAGGGFRYTGIAGPMSSSLQGVTGVSQGVKIAAINTDISAIDFELEVTKLLRDVESSYWQLSLAYLAYEQAASDLLDAERLLTNVQTRVRAQAGGGGTADEAEIKSIVYQINIEKNNALDSIYKTESQLRRLMSLPLDRCRLICPADRPVEAELLADWEASLRMALDSRPELRRQGKSIQSLELQLVAARNLTMPRLDFVSAIRTNGFGDHLLRDESFDGLTREGYNSAYHALLRGSQTGWELGFQFEMPLGDRLAETRVRNIRLQLAKARAILREQEVEISHELADVFRELDRTWMDFSYNQMRLEAARTRAGAIQTQFGVKGDTETLIALARAKRSVSEAELARASSLVQYAQAQADLQFRMGTLLRMNNIYFSAEDFRVVWSVPDHFAQRPEGMAHGDSSPLYPVTHNPDVGN